MLWKSPPDGDWCFHALSTCEGTISTMCFSVADYTRNSHFSIMVIIVIQSKAAKLIVSRSIDGYSCQFPGQMEKNVLTAAGMKTYISGVLHIEL